MRILTKKQRDVYNFILEFLEKNKMQPSFDQIAEHFNVTKGTIFGHINALQRKEILENRGLSRGLFLKKGKQ